MAKFGHIVLVYYSLAIPAKSIMKWLALDILWRGYFSDNGQQTTQRFALLAVRQGHQ